MIEMLKKQMEAESREQKSLTENNAVAYATTGKALLDMNFKTSSYRHCGDTEIIGDWIKSFSTLPELSLKWLFYARDVREGLGERRLFRVAFKEFLQNHPFRKDSIESEKVGDLISAIAEYGRYDDLVYMLDVESWFGFIFGYIKAGVEIEERLAKGNHPISLAAKWLPSINTSSKKTRDIAKKIIKTWGISEKEYRTRIAALRKYLDVLERKLSANEWADIDYSKIPSLANLKYRKAFLKHDEERRKAFLEKVDKGEAKINSSVNFPHDIVNRYTEGSHQVTKELQTDLEALWKALPAGEISDTLVVADGSGSMAYKVGRTSVSALDVANAMAIYTSERNNEPYKNRYITFSDHPQFVEFKEGDSLRQKLQTAFEHDEIASTNVEAVFDLILNTALKNNLKKSEMVKNVLIISDMEFNAAVIDNSDTLFDGIADKYKDAGYLLPRLVFWNVNSRTNTIPIQQNKNGLSLISGFSTNLLKAVMNGKLDPFAALKEILESERYERIKW